MGELTGQLGLSVNPSMTQNYSYCPGHRALLIYSTFKCVHDRTVHRGRQCQKLEVRALH